MLTEGMGEVGEIERLERPRERRFPGVLRERISGWAVSKRVKE
jgi:hypothetical protein